MIEVEVKLAVPSLECLEEELVKMGFCYLETIEQEDRYYDSEDCLIRSSGQALRLRKVAKLSCDDRISSENTVITFKGKKLDLVSMTRKELETDVADFSIMDQILNELGFFAVQPIVKKMRKEFELSEVYEMHACLDQVEGLGAYLELEIMTEEDKREDALFCIEKILKHLGFSVKDTTTNSYLSLLQGVED